jgi:hypothetical protein
MRVSSNCSFLSFGPNGFPRTAPGLCAPAQRLILLCDDRGNRPGAGGQISTARTIRIGFTGRGQVHQDLVDTTADIALVPGAACP